MVLDYILQCNIISNKFGVEPHIADSPECLKKYLGRKVWFDIINNISTDETKWSAGYRCNIRWKDSIG